MNLSCLFGGFDLNFENPETWGIRVFHLLSCTLLGCRIVGIAHNIYNALAMAASQTQEMLKTERTRKAGLQAIATDVPTYLQGIQSAPPPQAEKEDMETDGKVLMISWWPTQFSETAVDSHCQSTARFGAMARIRQEHFRVFCVQDESRGPVSWLNYIILMAPVMTMVGYCAWVWVCRRWLCAVWSAKGRSLPCSATGPETWGSEFSILLSCTCRKDDRGPPKHFPFEGLVHPILGGSSHLVSG